MVVVHPTQARRRKQQKANAQQRALKESDDAMLHKWDSVPKFAGKWNTQAPKKRLTAKQREGLRAEVNKCPIKDAKPEQDARVEKHKSKRFVDMRGATGKNQPQVYTGGEMIGVAQMHKSNAIPVFRKEDAVDISKMRRG